MIWVYVSLGDTEGRGWKENRVYSFLTSKVQDSTSFNSLQGGLVRHNARVRSIITSCSRAYQQTVIDEVTEPFNRSDEDSILLPADGD